MATRLSDIVRAIPARLRLQGTAAHALETARHRLVIGGLLFAVAFAVVGGRLVDVTLLTEAREPRAARVPNTGPLELARADIVDRNGVLLATSLVTQSLYANPKLIANPEATARRLAAVLPGLDERAVRERLASDQRSFVWIRRSLTPRQQYEVNRLGVPGLFFQREERRVYPHGVLASHAVGFSDLDNRGLAGAEQAFDERLKTEREPVRLSLDIRAQHVVREEIKRAIEDFNAIGGMGVLLDVATGETLAMVSLPDFDSNAPGLADDDARFNRNTLGTYEMGSTFKMFTAAMGFDSGAVRMQDSWDASRPYTIGRFTISDFHGKNRWLTTPEVFIFSSNLGALRMAQRIGVERQRDFMDRVGFLRPSPIELPEVSHPLIPKPWREINALTISYGHGITVSPMQLVGAAAASVGGGILRPVTILAREEGVRVPGERVMSAAASAQLNQLMRLNVERGSGRSAEVAGYYVGGKTGTAEKIQRGGYKKNSRISSFVAAFPAHDPKYVLLVMVDEPQGRRETGGYATGGVVAAPTAGRIIARVAPLMGLAPMREAVPDLTQPLLAAATLR
ncbi:MAG: penicillin-binding protein 2 [Magnetospirillum sp.]|jgi:cell division protein FtsI (penicillin-binding protein 3)|nr:penicillin-binding protein 2 [Magnetospirillum sp.]